MGDCLSYDETIHPDDWEAASQEVLAYPAFVPTPGFVPPGASAPFGGATGGARRCPRCPQQADGSPTMHPLGQRCSVVCKCEVCFSVQHMAHACFVANGVPKTVKMSAEMTTELNRLHGLYVAGKFDAMSTPTTLRHLL